MPGCRHASHSATMCAQLNWLSALLLLGILAATQSQLPPPPPPPPLYYHSWLYATSWRPLVPATPFDMQQLSLGYTGPQIFPGAAGQPQAPISAVRRPVLVGLLRPAREQFTLPFRPSPFAGYTNDADDDEEEQQQQQRSEHPVDPEPPFFAPGYPQVPAPNAPSLVGQDQAEQLPEQAPQQPQRYLYMAPSNQYNLVRS